MHMCILEYSFLAHTGTGQKSEKDKSLESTLPRKKLFFLSAVTDFFLIISTVEIN